MRALRMSVIPGSSCAMGVSSGLERYDRRREGAEGLNHAMVQSLEHVPFAMAHFTHSDLLFFEHLYPSKRFRLNG